jgi:hypothetical protein
VVLTHGVLILREARYEIVGTRPMRQLLHRPRIHVASRSCDFGWADEATHPVVRADCHKRVVPHQFTKYPLTHFIASRMRVACRTRRPGV